MQARAVDNKVTVNLGVGVGVCEGGCAGRCMPVHVLIATYGTLGCVQLPSLCRVVVSTCQHLLNKRVRGGRWGAKSWNGHNGVD